MIKQMAIVCRRPGMTKEEFINHIKHIHGYQITASNPLTIKKYNQNYVYDSVYGADTDNVNGGYKVVYNYDSITELYFDSIESMNKTFSDPYVAKVVGPDADNFAEYARQQSFLVEEKDIKIPNQGNGGMKIYFFLKRNKSIDKKAFRELWMSSHDYVIEKYPNLAKELKRFVENVQVKGSEDSYFSDGTSNKMPEYDGIAIFRFDTIAAFREYQKAFETRALEENDFLNRSESFALFVDQNTILDRI